MNNANDFYLHLLSKFPFTPTINQDKFLNKISTYIFSSSNNSVYLLKGYAGTGKTTLISTLVNELQFVKKKYVLMAPTGRASKVMSNYAKKPASTIHKRIYFPEKNSSGKMNFVLQQNKFKDTIFIVDEASMIANNASDKSAFENNNLLDDLLFYASNGNNCKIIFVGDTAQLPPVNSSLSPALDEKTLNLDYGLEVFQIELDEVVRQEELSGILYNATYLREILRDMFLRDFIFSTKNFKDVINLTDGYDIQDAIQRSYSEQGVQETTIIVRTNKRANLYNKQIRNKILGLESEISVGDILMIVKNNYFCLPQTYEAGFIANGDTIEILELKKIEYLYNCKFATVVVKMIDYPNQPSFETVLLLNTINSESPSLTYEESNQLYQEVIKDYENEKPYRKLMKLRNNKYFNALQVKFAYAVTCHKSQGGQWNTVFLEQPFLPNGPDLEYYRWLYTAITRAKEKLYLIGFKNSEYEI